ncbi:MAG: sugar phosphate isomerase/epimerase [Anaerolineae bacterium]|nr:sugar phosphate isomerase/epimerase [Anaerolineae bacterium]
MPSTHPLALSTMWLQNRFSQVGPFLAAGRGLGFDHFELSHVVTPAMLDGRLGEGDGIVSIHYPAPAVPHPSAGWAVDALLSSPNEEERRWAVERGRVTIELAHELDARGVVLHLGEVYVDASLEWALRQRYLAGQAGNPAYERLRARLWEQREERKPQHLIAARRSLRELAGYAARASIRLGIETRFHIHQIPSPEELAGFLAEFGGDTVGYWHDTGHAQTLANLGFWQVSDWLDVAGGRIVGVHLHDCRGWRDHLIPGTGEVDFAGLASRLPEECLRVCEFDWYFEEEEIRQGVRALRQAGI